MKELSSFDKYSLKYFMYTTPVFVGVMIWMSFKMSDVAELTILTGGLWDVYRWFFAAWILILFYNVTKMLYSKNYRDRTMARIAGIKERDERETIVAGNAAKFSFLSTFALLLFMLVFSVSTLTVVKKPDPTTGKKGTIGLTFSMKAIDEMAVVHEKKEGMESFKYAALPLAKPLIILLLMVWQIGCYQLVARRELRE